MTDLFNTPSKRFAKIAAARHAVGKYSEDQPRDESGRWTAGGVAAAVGGGLAAAAGLAAAGVPGARHVLPGIRRAVIGARTRGAQSATSMRSVYARGDKQSIMDQARAGLTGLLGTGGHSRGAVDATRSQLGRISPATLRRTSGVGHSPRTQRWLDETQRRLGGQRGSLRLSQFSPEQQSRIMNQYMARHGTIRGLRID